MLFLFLEARACVARNMQLRALNARRIPLRGGLRRRLGGFLLATLRFEAFARLSHASRFLFCAHAGFRIGEPARLIFHAPALLFTQLGLARLSRDLLLPLTILFLLPVNHFHLRGFLGVLLPILLLVLNARLL